jgi:hypothetical protein
MGIGKSMSVKNVSEQIANEKGLEFCDNKINGKNAFCFMDVRISQLDPSDLRGLPYPENGKTVWLPPSWLPQEEKSNGILFFDELNLAPPSIQAAAYQLILERRLGEYELPEGWLIVSAGNTSEDRANVFELPAPLSNRFLHVELGVPSKEEWTMWAINNNIQGSIISFLELKPSFLYTFDKKKKFKAFATPRTWEYTSRLIEKEKDKDLDYKEILVSSSVGEGVASEFIAFLKLKEKININEILKKPETVKKITSLDLRYSLLGAIVEKYREDNKVLGQALEVTNYLEAEYAILLLRFLKATRKTFVKDAIKLPIWKELYKKYHKFTQDG